MPAISKNLDKLHQLFKYYCSFGEPLNSTTLKSIKFSKMLKKCGLMEKVI